MTKSSAQWIFYDSYSKSQSNQLSTEDAQMAIFKMRRQDIERFFIWTVGWEKWQPLKAYLESNQQYFVTDLATFKNKNNFSEEITIKALERDVLQMKPVTKEVEDELTNSGYDTNAKVKMSSETVTNAKLDHKSYSGISLDNDDFLKNDHTFDSKQFDGDEMSLSGIEKPRVDFTKINMKSALDNRADRHELKIEILLISTKGKTFRSKSKNISLSGALVEDNIPFDYCGISFDVVVINKQPCDPKFQRVSLRAKTVGEGLTQRIYYVDMTDKQKKDLHNLLENYIKIQKKLPKSA